MDNPYPAWLSHEPTDHLLDLSIYSQFQWITRNQAFSIQAAHIREMQHWAASFCLGATADLP